MTAGFPYDRKPLLAKRQTDLQAEVAKAEKEKRRAEQKLQAATQPPSPYREAITLTELEGRTQREAAEMLGISLSGMKSRVQRGRAKLRAMLEACCEIAVDARGKVIACEPRAAGSKPRGCCGEGSSSRS